MKFISIYIINAHLNDMHKNIHMQKTWNTILQCYIFSVLLCCSCVYSRHVAHIVVTHTQTQISNVIIIKKYNERREKCMKQIYENAYE